MISRQHISASDVISCLGLVGIIFHANIEKFSTYFIVYIQWHSSLGGFPFPFPPPFFLIFKSGVRGYTLWVLYLAVVTVVTCFYTYRHSMAACSGVFMPSGIG